MCISSDGQWMRESFLLTNSIQPSVLHVIHRRGWDCIEGRSLGSASGDRTMNIVFTVYSFDVFHLWSKKRWMYIFRVSSRLKRLAVHGWVLCNKRTFSGNGFVLISSIIHYFESRPLEFAFFESRTFSICAHYTVTKIPNSYSQIFNCETTLPIMSTKQVFPERNYTVVVCRACLHSFFIDRQSTRELRITSIPRDAVI